jgi:lipopolysaccharide transport system ATP-binding protein
VTTAHPLNPTTSGNPLRVASAATPGHNPGVGEPSSSPSSSPLTRQGASSEDLAIRVRGLSKAYTIAHDRVRESTLAETLLKRLRNAFKPHDSETFWALNDVNFDVQRGDVVGIIGRNGAGKSTLLKILSRITEPTKGRIELYGRVGSLLEVGTGFHPELTGRENIYLNGNILGMTRAEVRRQFDAIVDFSGVEKFLDTPVKRYSSGMYVRLAFAVAAHLRSDIMIIDEVLAVGDTEFQNKCLGKMKDVATDGRTVLFVSHNMAAVNSLCTRGIFMTGGRPTCVGSVNDAVDHYMASFVSSGAAESNPDRRSGTGEYRFTAVAPAKEMFDAGEPVDIRFRIDHCRGQIGKAHLSAHIVDEVGTTVAQCDSRLVGFWFQDTPSYTGSLKIATPWLKPGRYHVDVFICSRGFVDFFERACTVTVSPNLPYGNAISMDGLKNGVVLSDFAWADSDGVPTPPAATTADPVAAERKAD